MQSLKNYSDYDFNQSAKRQKGLKWHLKDQDGSILELNDKKQKRLHKEQRTIRKNRHNWLIVE